MKLVEYSNVDCSHLNKNKFLKATHNLHTTLQNKTNSKYKTKTKVSNVVSLVLVKTKKLLSFLFFFEMFFPC